MINLADFWYGWRHHELLREADEERLAKELRRSREARKAWAGRSTPLGSRMTASSRAVVRRGLPEDAPRIAELLELNGMPRWVTFEERFVVAEERGKLLVAVRFRESPGRLYLGLLATDPWAEEGRLAVELYAGALTVARGLGLREVRTQVGARTRRHEGHLLEAGYRSRGGVWRASV